MSETTVLPRHVGIILDGNRRWAKQQGITTLEGHRQGAEVFKEIALAAFERGVRFLSAFVFSTENWSRTEEEVGYLMSLVMKATEKYLDTFHEAGIKVIVIGRRDNLDDKVLKSIERTEARTKGNTRGTLVLCFSYGGQDELVDAVRHIIKAGIPAEAVTPETLETALYAPEVPPVDLIIRTSGEHRLSGFMLYRAAYAELYFIDKYWPDFTTQDLDEALAEYAQRERRYGS
jgi:undecaprenyl diphosphate synthase